MLPEEGFPDIRNIQHVAERILPYVHNSDHMKFFTDHSYFHSLRVLKYIDKIIEICDRSSTPLNEAEQLILRCSCWLHDIGCISEREKHAKKTVQIIQKLTERGYLDLGTIGNEIEYVIYTHSSNGMPLDNVSKSVNITGFDDLVRLRLLCALFRLADECDIDRLRAPKVIFNILEDEMPEKSKSWWKGHSNVIGVYFSNENKIRIVLQDDDESIEVINSLINTVNELRPIFNEYSFPYTTCECVCQKQVEIDG